MTTITIPSEIILKLWEVFPDSFSVSKVSPIYTTFNGGYGTEDVKTGEETIILAEEIAATAKAFSYNGSDMAGALKYIESYKPAWIQRREIRNFLKR